MPHETGTQGRSAQEAAWWRTWRDLDFSWSGLVRHPGHLGSLQDYWRNEEHRLISEPGTSRRWTRFHCPLIFDDGAPSPKFAWTPAEWADLHAGLRTRLAMGTRDRPALLTGIVLDGLWEAEPELPQSDGFLFLRANTVYFRDGLDLSRNGMGLADFREAWFGGKAVFEGARAVEAQFEGALYADRMPPSPVQPQLRTAVEAIRVTPMLAEPEPEAPAKRGLAARIVGGAVVVAVIAVAIWAAIALHP